MDSQDKLPDKCLICYCSTRQESSKPRPQSKRRKETDSSVLSSQLDSIFVLRNLLQVPVENLRMYLLTWGKPETWINLCLKCETEVQEARSIHKRAMMWNKRFREVQKRVIDGIRKSHGKWSADNSQPFNISERIITDQSRSFVSIYDYGHFTDPFLSGDNQAREQVSGVKLARKLSAVSPKSSIKKYHQEPVVIDDSVDNIIKTETNDAMDELDDTLNGQDEFIDADITDFQFQGDKEIGTSTYQVDPLDISSVESGHAAPNTFDMQQFDTNVDESNTECDKTIFSFPAKFCDECRVSFPVKTFDLHKKYWHKKEKELAQSIVSENAAESDVRPVQEESGQDECIYSESAEILMTVDKSKKSNSLLTCPLCSTTFKCELRAAAHKTLHETSPFHCFICRTVVKTPTGLRCHMSKFHQSAGQPKNNCLDNTGPRKTFTLQSQKCGICGRYVKHEMMRKHTELHNTSPYHCTVCSRVFENQRQLSCHVGKYHPRTFSQYKESLPPKVPRINSQAHSLKSRVAKADADTRRKSSRESKPTLKVQDPPRFYKMDTDQDADWNPKVEEQHHSKTVDKVPISKKRTKTIRTTFTKRKFMLCPACKKFKFKDGEVEKLMNHFELCKVIKSPTNEQDEQTLTCRRCADYKVSISEHKLFCEHLLMCEVNQQQVPLTHRIFECNICPSKFYFRVHEFLEHFLEHAKNIYKCSRCTERFPVESRIHRHWNDQHRDLLRQFKGIDERSVQDISTPEVTWWCKFCNKKFASEDERDAHLQTDHEAEVRVLDQKPHICQECNKSYGCSDELMLHQGTVHPTIPMNIHTCDICSLRLSTAKQLRDHRMKKHRIDLLQCEVCGLECNSYYNLKNHMQLHQEVRLHKCNECGESFALNTIPLDPKINPLVCPYCEPPTVLHNNSYLRQHIESIHKGQYKMRCEICQFGIHSQSGMKKHMALKHKIGSMKKYPCTVEGCKSVYLTPGKLAIHMTKHTGQPRWSCRFCGKTFHQKPHLTRHEHIHTNAETKPHVCHICAKRFPVRNYLYIHMKSHRRENPNV